MSGLSELGDLAADVTAYVWKLAVIVLLFALAGASIEWWLTARERDQARAGLAVERTRADQLSAAVREQNRAVDVLAAAKTAADARGLAAQQLAAANGKRFDGALAKIASAKAQTCADAIPAVNQLLESMQ